MNRVKYIFVDLFCGAGGVTSGICDAEVNGEKIGEVAVCVNHDENAIKSHAANCPECIHFIEDIRTISMYKIVKVVNERIAYWEKRGYEVLIHLWASLECTNFSKAKGGQSRDADSRTLAEHLFRYQQALLPHYIWIENVEEFMSWGPLDENGKPISRRKGLDYLNWVENMNSNNYKFDYRILNSADYGANTSRKRFFGCFTRPELPIMFPSPTHSKKPKMDMFGKELNKWRPVKECLNFSDEGQSIFTRKKPLKPKTISRILAGLIKHVAGGKEAFIKQYNSGSDYNRVIDLESPCNAIPTQNRFALVRAKFLIKYHGKGENIIGENETCSTLTTKDRLALINPEYWLDKQYSGDANHQSVESPCGALMPNEKHCLMKAVNFIDKQFSSGGKNSSIEEPAGTITTIPKMNLVSCNPLKTHYIINPSWGGNPGSIEEPCCTIVARQDKAPLYLVETEKGKEFVFENTNFLSADDIQYLQDVENNVFGPIFEKSNHVKVIEFMFLYGIVDIKMRMLNVPELLKIQGFPEGYVLIGTKGNQKKFIGNSVPPKIVKAIIEANYIGYCKTLKCA